MNRIPSYHTIKAVQRTFLTPAKFSAPAFLPHHIERKQYFAHIRRNPLHALLMQIIGTAVECFGDAAHNAGSGVGVAAKGDGAPDSINHARALEKGGNCLRDAAGAGGIHGVGRADLTQGTREVIAELLRDIVLDFTPP